MKIVFMGTPEFAVPSLQQLIEDNYDVIGVFTQPDKPKNRGMKLMACPVKKTALENALNVYQPVSLKGDESFDLIQSLNPDLIVVAAYGQILPKRILEIPKYGCINVHSSLLPKYRGAAPINRAIMNGETETGVTIMYMAEGLDTGDIILQRKTEIGINENAEELHDRLALIGADILSDAVKEIESGDVHRIPQDDSKSNYAAMLDRSLSPIDFNKTAQEIHNQIRGLVSWPAATFELNGIVLKVFASVLTGESSVNEPGTILGVDKTGINIVCGDGKILKIIELQAPGKKRMRAVDYLRGHSLF